MMFITYYQNDLAKGGRMLRRVEGEREERKRRKKTGRERKRTREKKYDKMDEYK
jgi:hypothetical protein